MKGKHIILMVCMIGILLVSGCTSYSSHDSNSNRAVFESCMNAINRGEPVRWHFETQTCVEVEKVSCQILYNWDYIELYEGWAYFIRTATGKYNQLDEQLIENRSGWSEVRLNGILTDSYDIIEEYAIANNSCILHQIYMEGQNPGFPDWAKHHRNRIKNNCKDHVFEVCVYDPNVTEEKYL